MAKPIIPPNYDIERLKKRLYSKIDKTPGQGPNGDCWIWTGCVNKAGYGSIGVGQNRGVRVHRLIWELEYGPIPEGVEVCHKCDVKRCVRCLFLGTHQDNMDDMTSKNRQTSWRKKRHPHAKLTDEQIHEICQRRGNGETLRTIAKAFGISQTHVSEIARGKVWHNANNVGADPEAIRAFEIPRGERARAAKLTAEQVIAIRQAYAAGGISQGKLALQYGINQRTVHKIVRYQRWKHLP